MSFQQQPYGYPVHPGQAPVFVQVHRCSTAHVVIAWVVTVLTAFYMLPWAVAASRNRRNVASIAMINLFLGWSIVGWIVALVMACGSDQPLVVVQQPYPQQPYPPQPYPPQPYAQQPPPYQPQPYQPQPTWQQQPGVQDPPRPAQPSLPPGATYRPAPAAEPTMVDPFGSEPTQQLPRSPWEPDHRR